MLADSVDFPITVAEIAASLQHDPILIEPTMGSGHTAELHQRLTTLAHQLPYPVYVALVSDPRDLTSTSAQPGSDLAVALHQKLGKPAIYIVETAKHRAITVRPFGISVPGEQLSLAASSNVERLMETMQERHGKDSQVYLAPGVDAQAAIESALHPMPQQGAGYPFPQYLPKSVVADLMSQQDDLMRQSPSDEDGDSSFNRLMVATAVGVGLLLGVPFTLLIWRRQRRLLAAARAKRGGLATHHPGPRELADYRTRAGAELAALAEELSALASPPPDPEVAQQALLAQQAAETLHRGRGTAETIGALVLTRIGRRDVARAARHAEAPYRPCFFDPMHGEASTTTAWQYGEGDVTVPVCDECRRALVHGRVVTALALRSGSPYFEGRDVWARTGFGSLVDDLAAQVMADRSSRR